MSVNLLSDPNLIICLIITLLWFSFKFISRISSFIAFVCISSYSFYVFYRKCILWSLYFVYSSPALMHTNIKLVNVLPWNHWLILIWNRYVFLFRFTVKLFLAFVKPVSKCSFFFLWKVDEIFKVCRVWIANVINTNWNIRFH